MLRKALIVEDDTLLAKMYGTVFSSSYPGCQTLFAGNGVEALDALAAEKGDVDIIILDINMPKMDGLTFLKHRVREGYGHIPVIVISTEGKDADIRRALKAGAKAFIKKPWSPTQVKDLVDKLLQLV
jgi:two-component system, chemotaxis family, chemotaxis protein CheY